MISAGVAADSAAGDWLSSSVAADDDPSGPLAGANGLSSLQPNISNASAAVRAKCENRNKAVRLYRFDFSAYVMCIVDAIIRH